LDGGDRCYREIRSARFPLGLPDRSDLTVIDAFADAWLLIEHRPSGTQLAGVAEDYDAARAWLAQHQGTGGHQETGGPEGS
jgi:hypothetical protein